MHAAANGHVDALELLAKKGARIDAVDKDEWSALHFAAKSAHNNAVRRLIEFGLAPNPIAKRPRKYGLGYPSAYWRAKVNGPPPLYTPLRLAIQYGHFDVVKEILPLLKPQDVILPHLTKGKGKTILHYAASRDRAEIVAAILEAGLVDVNEADKAGRTALTQAIKDEGKVKTVRVLLKHGADPRLSSPLHICALERTFSESCRTATDIVDIAATLLAAGADIDAKDKDGNTALFIAAEEGFLKIVQCFLDSGADVHVRNNVGETPLHRTRDIGVINLLLRAGIDVNAKDEGGNTALHAIKHRLSSSYSFYLWPEVLSLFVQHGCDPYILNNQGDSAFHLPVGTKGHKLGMLSKIPGIDINARDKLGRTLLHLGIDPEDDLPPGLDLDAQDSEGNTALHHCFNLSQLKKLLAAGANPLIKNRKGKLPIHTLVATELKVSRSLYHFEEMNIHGLLQALSEGGINLTDNHGNTPFHIVAEACPNKGTVTDVVKNLVHALVEMGADVQARNIDGRTALHLAAASDTHIYVFLEYMTAGVNDEDADGRTPLHYAAESHSSVGISAQELIDASADVSVRDRDGRTPLHFAARAGNANNLLTLIHYLQHPHQDLSLAIDQQDYSGVTALHYAANSGSYAAVKCLLDAGARVDIKTIDGQTPLHFSARFGHTGRSRVLPDEESKLYKGWGAEREITRQRPRIRDVARLLLESGGNPDVADKNNNLPLHVAGNLGTTGVLEALHEWGKKSDPTAEVDLTTWVSRLARRIVDQDQICDDVEGPHFALLRAAVNFRATTGVWQMLATAIGPREALEMAVLESNEAAVCELLRSDIIFESTENDAYPEPDSQITSNLPEIPFKRGIVRQVIEQGWLSVLFMVIDKFGFDDYDAFAIVRSREPNLEILQVLLPRMTDPNVKGESKDSLLERFASSCLPWHPNAVKILLNDPRVDAQSKALHRALNYGYTYPRAEAWAAKTVRQLVVCPNVDINAPTEKIYHSFPETTPLIIAARTPSMALLLETLIEAGADVNLMDPLTPCVEHPNSVRVLLAAGTRLPEDHFKLLERLHTRLGSYAYNPNKKLRELLTCCESLKLVLASGLDINALSPRDSHAPKEQSLDGHTGFGAFRDRFSEYKEPRAILHHVAYHPSPDVFVDHLISKASLEVRDASGRTPLLVCCASSGRQQAPNNNFLDSDGVAIRLLNAGASPIAVDNSGYSALDCLFTVQKDYDSKRLRALFEALINSGAILAPSRHNTLSLALKQTISHKEHEPRSYSAQWSALQLLQNGLDAGLHIRDSEGNIAMHVFLPDYMAFTPTHPLLFQTDTQPACEDVQTQELLDTIFAKLLEAGHESNSNALLVRNNKGETPLHTALQTSRKFVGGALEKVIEAVGGPSIVRAAPPTTEGRTLLHACGEQDVRGRRKHCDTEGQIKAMRYLLDMGLDIGQRDCSGLTPLELASLMGHEELVTAFGAV